MGSVLVPVEEVVDGVAVSEDDVLVSPLVAEDIGEEPVAAAARLSLVTVVCAHNFLYVAVNYKRLEGGEIGLPEVTHGYPGVEAVAQGLRSAVHRIVLCTSVGLEIFLVVALHSQYGLYSKDAGQIRVLSAGLLSASPARVTEDVDVRTPEGQFRISGNIVGAHANVEDVVVRAVPVGAGLVRYGVEHVKEQFGIEGRCHSHRLRINGVPAGAHAVAGLAPPVVGRNSKAVDGYGLVHHKAHLLLRSKQGDQIVHPGFIGELWILERVLVIGT